MNYEYKDTRDTRIKRYGQVYHARFSCKGHRIQRSLFTKNFDVAKAMTDRIQNGLLIGDFSFGDAKKNLFEDKWPEFLDAKAKGKGKRSKTRKARASTIAEYTNLGRKHFLPFFGEMVVDKITGDTWEEYMKHVHSGSPGIKFFNHWKYLHGFFNWLFKNDHIGRMPDIYNPDQTDEESEDEDGVGINYTDEQLALFREHSKQNPRFHLYIMMAQYMGLRSSEITQASRDRINLTGGFLKLRRKDTKNRKARNVPIHPLVMPLLVAQLASHDHPYLFPNRADKQRPMDTGGFKKPWNKIREDLGINGRFHDLRHSYATRIFAKPEVNPLLASQALGMSIVTAQKVYIHFTDRDLHLVTFHYSLPELQVVSK